MRSSQCLWRKGLNHFKSCAKGIALVSLDASTPTMWMREVATRDVARTALRLHVLPVNNRIH